MKYYLKPMVFAVILSAHWVGDYLLQSTKMAVEKSSSLKWLSLHVLVYTLTLGLFSFFLFPMRMALSYFLLNGFFHLVTDFFTSKLASKYQERPRVFYPILGFDQLVHTLCLYITYVHIENLP